MRRADRKHRRDLPRPEKDFMNAPNVSLCDGRPPASQKHAIANGETFARRRARPDEELLSSAMKVDVHLQSHGDSRRAVRSAFEHTTR